MNCFKYILSRRSTHKIIPNTFTLQASRGLTTQGTELASSSSSSKYEGFFPSYCREYVSNTMEWYTSTERDDFWINKPVRKRPTECHHFECKPHYTSDAFDDFNNIEPILVQKGQHFDVISLLSTHADHLIRIGFDHLVEASDLRGKYILLICAFVPSIWTDPFGFQDISILLSEIYQTHLVRNHFEVVIVPKMRKKWDTDEGVFRHFISAFPNCLAVPSIDKYRCDYICKSLNFEGKPKFVFVDPTQKVLQVDYRPIVKFGARGFPFTDKHLGFLSFEADWGVPNSPSIKSLPGLLCCESNPSSVLLCKFDSEETISVEQLNKHHVGLYMFVQGNFLQNVKYIHKQCRDQGVDFEIVLVCLPFVTTSLDPEVYQDVVSSILKKHQISDWWVFPYNNSICRRLYQLREFPVFDFMFMVGPHNKFVDRQAGEVLHNFGPHFGSQAFPFTIKALLQAYLQRLDKITLESILTYDYLYRDYECDDGKIIPVSELRGKNVLVYVRSCLGPVWEDDVKWYNIIKEKDPDFEVVLVPVSYRVSDSEYPKHISKVRECILKSRTKWLVCPFDNPKQSRFLDNHDAFLFQSGVDRVEKGLPLPGDLAFGKDGHLHSLQAPDLLKAKGLDAYPFLPEARDQILCDEITQELCYHFELYDDTVVSL